MVWTKPKFKVVVSAAILLALCIATVVTISSPKKRLKLPVGHGTPAISLGERHGLILASDGSLWSWGSDFLGWPVLGLGNFTNNSTILRCIGNQTNWVGISAGTAHNLAIKSDGTLWAWGENLRYQLGDGTRSKRNAPAPAAPGNDWKQAAAGGYFSVALKRNGTIWVWGDNWAGQLGIGNTNRPNPIPVQVGSATNWIKVWAGILETVALQSDGSLWYWGENPNPAFAQGAGQIVIPTRISPDTDWVDVGFGVNTVFAIKSDGTLWTWGRNAHVYTGVSDQSMDASPVRIGTNSDWQSISPASGWWCQGLIKKDGSLWFMDASDGKPNGPRTPYQPVQFRQIEFQKDYAAYCAGATHAAAPGVHGPIGVILTRDGEVWTWGMVLGDPPTLGSSLQTLASRLAGYFHFKTKIPPGDPAPIYREKPWQLRNLEPDGPKNSNSAF